MRNLALPLVAAFAALLIAAFAVRSRVSAQGADDVFDDLKSNSAEKREDAADRLVGERSETILRLLKIALAERGSTELEQARADASKDRAIFLLGQYRASEAVRLLVQEIEFPNYGTGETTDVGPLAGYRAAKALANVGDPAATRAILERMGEPVSDNELGLFSHVIAALQGRGNEKMGVARLTAALEALQKADPDRADGAEVKSHMTRVKNLKRLLATYRETIARAPYYAE